MDRVIGVAGHSGTGKSTLTKLVQRLYVPERGRLLVEGARTKVAAFVQQVRTANRTNTYHFRQIAPRKQAV